MPLIKPRPSTKTRKAYEDGLTEMIQLGRAPADLPPGVDPQRLYSLDLHDVVDGTGIAGAKPVVWQFLVGTAAGPAVACEVGNPPAGKAPRLTSLLRGAPVTQAIQATQDVARLPQVKNHKYQLRRLHIGGFLGAFWLKSLQGGTDLIVPFHAVAEELKPMHAYTVDEFLTVVRPLALKRLKKAV